MLPIFICEDDAFQRVRLEEIIENYIVMEDFCMKIALSTEDPFAILDDLEQNHQKPGLYFFDIDLNSEMNGIELASKVRKLDPEGKIIFVTTHAELAPSIFKHKIEALDYIVKDQGLNEVKKSVVECIKIVQERRLNAKESDQNLFKLKIKDKIHLIPFSEIMFFKKADAENRVDLHLENRQMQFRRTLSELEESSSVFVRIHRTILVNKGNIKHINTQRMEIEMVNGEVCIVSVRGLRELKKVIKE